MIKRQNAVNMVSCSITFVKLYVGNDWRQVDVWIALLARAAGANALPQGAVAGDRPTPFYSDRDAAPWVVTAYVIEQVEIIAEKSRSTTRFGGGGW